MTYRSGFKTKRAVSDLAEAAVNLYWTENQIYMVVYVMLSSVNPSREVADAKTFYRPAMFQ